jgi:acyl carrier protein
MPVEDTIKGIVTKIVRCDNNVLTPESTWQDLKADSLDMVQILIAIEEKFDIEVPDEDVQNIQNFGQFVAYVEERVANKG